MPAPEKSSLNDHDIKTLGIIAGGGAIPARLIEACASKKQDIFIVGFEGQTDPAIVEGHNFMMTRLGAAGQIISTLRAHDVRDLVLIGSIRRPGLAELRPDMRTAQFFAKLGLRALGDDGLLQALRHELESEGFKVHGVHKFIEDLLALPGAIGKYRPKKTDHADIKRGFAVSQDIGAMDIGQAVVIQDGIILGVEAAEGTDELIRRCLPYRRGPGGILVKSCKPQQDRDLDLPTIGPETVRLCADSGFSGIVIHAGRSLVVAPEEVAALADAARMFVYAIGPEGDFDAA